MTHHRSPASPRRRLDARLVPVLGLRPDVRRVPVFGLGCVAGAAGIARLARLAARRPRRGGRPAVRRAVLADRPARRHSMANLVASGLFGDGAAAVVHGRRPAGRAARHRRARTVVATRSRLYPDTERVMGWDIGGSGFRIVLSAGVADVVEEHLGEDVDGVPRRPRPQDRTTSRPGSRTRADPRCCRRCQRDARPRAGRPATAPGRRWRRSATCRRPRCCTCSPTTLAEPPPAPGSPAVLLAMGPGFCSELVLLRW